MLTIAFTFLGGRYHATAWDHHVNEGTVEWPPSPWRIVRALIAASYKLVPIVDDDVLRALIEPLLALPGYLVPAAGGGHTRHYMPTDQPGKPVKVFDAFAVPDGDLVVHWPDAELDAAQLGVLDRILSVLGYLGRAESWVEARRLSAPPAELNCTPEEGDRGNLVLNAPVAPADYQSWRDGFLAAQVTLAKKERRELPATWWEVLHIETDRLFRDGWSSPPGVRRVRYTWRQATAVSSRPAQLSVGRMPTVARFACASSVLPLLTKALSVGDRMRAALMGHSDAHWVFSGKQPDGARLTDHDHAYFAPSDDDADGYVDHVLVHARGGFDELAVRALQQLRKVWGHGGHDLMLALIGLGQLEDFGTTRRDAHRLGLSPLIGPREGARVWESHTPFVPPRYTKRRRGTVIDSPEDQVRALLAKLGRETEVSISAIAPAELSAPCASKPADWYRFHLERKGGGARGGHRSFGFRLTFAQPVLGPIALGYGAHHGLGQFVAIE
ncbi:MAG TPA: type I-U CRISPR-associated protein Csb2 [Kofleriaceae bacterium]|nr:type I-U CRISPR-associated protein Csb2 [Kofleriaceae bacterium]